MQDFIHICMFMIDLRVFFLGFWLSIVSYPSLGSINILVFAIKACKSSSKFRENNEKY